MDQTNHSERRYTVHRAKIPGRNVYKESFLILDEGIPALEVNRALITQDRDYARPSSCDRYHLCKFLNWLDAKNLDYLDASMEVIHAFLVYIYEEEAVSYDTLRAYIRVISRLYETLAITGVAIDQSILVPRVGKTPVIIRNKKSDHVTKVHLLIQLFRVRNNRSWEAYTKWYTPEQIDYLAEELAIPYRCIFYCTVLLGYRCSSALSVKVSSVDLKNKRIRPTHSKTGMTHTSEMPVLLATLLKSYVENERSKNPGSMSEWLFLNNRGTQMTYHNYYQALKRAANRVRIKHPEADLGDVHTHAGRSTFAAALRTYQLRERRLGHNTFSDADFCTMMDWKSLECLKNYDKTTRIQEISPLVYDLYDNFREVLTDNAGLIRLN